MPRIMGFVMSTSWSSWQTVCATVRVASSVCAIFLGVGVLCENSSFEHAIDFAELQLTQRYTVPFVSPAELEQFQHSEKDGGMQGRDHYVDTKHVADMLRAQSELKHMMEEYVVVHHQPETFDMYDV